LHSLLASLTTFLRPYETHRLPNIVTWACVVALLVGLPFLPGAYRFRGISAEAQQQAEELKTESRHGVRGSSSPTPPLPSDTGFPECLCSRWFWFLFFALAAGEGAGLMVLNSMGQLVRAFDNDSSDLQTACVATFSVANSIGRLAMGKLASSTRMQNTQLLILALAGTAVAYVLFAFCGSRAALLLAVPVLGFGYGSLWSLMPLLVSEVVGLRSYGSKYAMLALAAVVGSAPLSRVVVPFFYDMHTGRGDWCVGADCFRGSLYCAGASCFLGAVLAWCLHGACARGTLDWQVLWSFEEEVDHSGAAGSAGPTGSQERHGQNQRFEQCHDTSPDLLGCRSDA